jgi:AcrR family transcriptional regulator
LERAALELFAAQGYDNTTVEQISARAGLARSTFFRHFSDKREILFGGADGLAVRFGDSIKSAPAEQTALEAVETAFGDVADIWFTPERRDLAPRRIAVITAHPDLAERDLLKRRGVTEAIAAALRSRGASEPTAAVAAELATLTFSKTVTAWAEPNNTEDFASIARRLLRSFHDVAAHLT